MGGNESITGPSRDDRPSFNYDVCELSCKEDEKCNYFVYFKDTQHCNRYEYCDLTPSKVDNEAVVFQMARDDDILRDALVEIA